MGEWGVQREKRRGHARADLHALEQLVDLLVAHLLAQLRQHVAQLARADEPVALLVEHLEPADELLCAASASQPAPTRIVRTWRPRGLEAVRPVQDGQERLVVHWRAVSTSGGAEGEHAPSRGAPATMSATSACVGFWPSARRRSPSTSRGTAPVPFLSNSANASLYSAVRRGSAQRGSRRRGRH